MLILADEAGSTDNVGTESPPQFIHGAVAASAAIVKGIVSEQADLLGHRLREQGNGGDSQGADGTFPAVAGTETLKECLRQNERALCGIKKGNGEALKGKLIILDIQLCAACFDLVTDHAMTDILCQLIQRQPYGVIVVQIADTGGTMTDGFNLRKKIFRCNGGKVFPAGKGAHHQTVFAKAALDQVNGCLCQCSDCGDAHLV